MADVKISALPLASTPLAGTEVLPIVQSATTDQVSVANLTAGRAVSAASLTLTTTPLAVGSGGTGLTSLTATYIPYGNGTSAFNSSANLTFNGSTLTLTGSQTITSSSTNSTTFNINNTATSGRLWTIYSSGGGPATAGFFGIYDNTGGAGNRLVIDTSGNLGLGTPSPSNFGAGYKTLDVAGTSGAGVVQVKSTSVTSRWQADESGALLFKTVTNHPIQFYTNDQPVVRIDTSGNLLVGTTSPDARLVASKGTNDIIGRIAQTASSGITTDIFQVTALNHATSTSMYLIRGYTSGPTAQFAVRSDGVIYAQNTTVQSISDRRVKENITLSMEGLDVISGLRPVRFDFKSGFGNNRKNQLGFIAQEVETVFSDAVETSDEKTPDGDYYKTVGPGAFIPVIVKAIQELAAKVAALEAKK